MSPPTASNYCLFIKKTQSSVGRYCFGSRLSGVSGIGREPRIPSTEVSCRRCCKNIFNRWMPCSHPSARRLHGKSWGCNFNSFRSGAPCFKMRANCSESCIPYERDCNHDKKNGICHACKRPFHIRYKKDSPWTAFFLIKRQ